MNIVRLPVRRPNLNAHRGHRAPRHCVPSAYSPKASSRRRVSSKDDTSWMLWRKKAVISSMAAMASPDVRMTGTFEQARQHGEHAGRKTLTRGRFAGGQPHLCRNGKDT